MNQAPSNMTNACIDICQKLLGCKKNVSSLIGLWCLTQMWLAWITRNTIKPLNTTNINTCKVCTRVNSQQIQHPQIWLMSNLAARHFQTDQSAKFMWFMCSKTHYMAFWIGHSLWTFQVNQGLIEVNWWLINTSMYIGWDRHLFVPIYFD